ncbi:hypothetical protein ANANG_G00192300 [Anguilla anguilla]|uniref:Uncharacterized protein n=1 Tax=Anguilla anguilla TaxID=7936 RepID=A0A9D3M1B9_ANGAN|nr:hypothetical protein ANANG_G00192300 [Anguilla anguilla]
MSAPGLWGGPGPAQCSLATLLLVPLSQALFGPALSYSGPLIKSEGTSIWAEVINLLRYCGGPGLACGPLIVLTAEMLGFRVCASEPEPGLLLSGNRSAPSLPFLVPLAEPANEIHAGLGLRWPHKIIATSQESRKEPRSQLPLSGSPEALGLVERLK